MELDAAIRGLAETQHGLVSVDQLLAAGASRDAIEHRVGRGVLVRMSPRALRLAGAPVTDRQQALAGVMDAGLGAALANQPALALWEVPGFRLLPADVCRVRTGARCRPRLTHVHELTTLPVRFVTVLDAIPVVRPELALLQIAGEVHELRVERAVDAALAKRITDLARLDDVLSTLARSGRNGVTVFRRLLAARSDGYRPPESGNESRLRWLLRAAGERELRQQVEVGGTSWIGRMDFADDEVPFVLQVDSERFHTALVDRIADERQNAALAAAGFVVRRVWDRELWHEPERVVAVVRSGRREAARVRRSVVAS
jgi:very-short-patch-repair endonuclease